MSEFRHPSDASQLSSVHSVPSSQSGATPAWHPLPVSQVSNPLQASPSSQTMATCVHAPLSSQMSSVHALPSSTQASPGSARQPCEPSLHRSEQSAAPEHGSPLCRLQELAAQVSEPLQNTPSSQGSELSAFTQPRPASQLSSVQTLPSSQLGAAPA